jgi:hypothetical protein
LIYTKPAVLRIWNVWKTRLLFVKIKIAPDTDIGRHEWHAGGGNEIMSACWASHLYRGEICGCVEKAGVGGHSTQGTFNLWMCWKSRRWWAQHAKARHFKFVDVLKKQALVGTTRKGT